MQRRSIHALALLLLRPSNYAQQGRSEASTDPNADALLPDRGVEMDIPVKVAYCPLFFASHGGQFNHLGMPIFGGRIYNYEDGNETYDEEEDEEGNPIKIIDPFVVASNCDRPFDCGQCVLLKRWVEDRMCGGWEATWECDGCLNEWFLHYKEDPNIEWQVAGFYQSGMHPDVGPEDEINHDPDKPGCTGCFSCGRNGTLLQLMLRHTRR
jgi:hypothetical protein